MRDGQAIGEKQKEGRGTEGGKGEAALDQIDCPSPLHRQACNEEDDGKKVGRPQIGKAINRAKVNALRRPLQETGNPPGSSRRAVLGI